MGETLTSYAADTDLNEQDNNTNSDNVKFDVYFDTANKTNKVIEKDINTEDLKLFVSVSVQNGGYLNNGKIEFSDCNFNLKSGENAIELEQIQSGKNLELYANIEARKDNLFDLNLLNKVSQIKLTGDYIDNSGNIVAIDSTKQVQISWTADNITEENNPIKLNQEVITNKIYNINGTNKRVVQLLVTSGIENNKYPIKSTEVELTVPALGELYPEKVVVASYNTMATNGKNSTQFGTTEDNKAGQWSYNEADHKVNIIVNNEPTENKIYWGKDGEDKFVVTYVYAEGANVSNFASNINSKISLCETKNRELTKQSEITKENMIDFGEAITAEVNGSDVIYKGNMNIGKDTEFEVDWTIETGYSEVVKAVNILNPEDKLILENGENEEKTDALAYYKTTYINKEEFIKMFGENKDIVFIYGDSEDEKTIQINSDTETDSEGNICIEHKENITVLAVSINSNPITEGKLNIKHKKVLSTSEYSKEEIDKIIKLESSIGKYDQENDEVIYKEDEKVSIYVQNTKPEVAIGLDIEKLPANQEKQINLTATLKTSDLKYSLYENPVVDIELPKEVESVVVNSASMYDESEHELKMAKDPEIINGENKVIRITLEGKQTKYIGKDVQILINANLKTTKLIPTTEEYINIKCSQNDTVIAQNSCKIKFIAEQGILLANSISNYNNSEPEISVFKNETKTGLLSADSEAVTATGKLTIINNASENYLDTNIIIIGKGALKFTLEENAQAYYTNDAEITLNSNWVEQYSEEATGYKIVLNKLEKGEVLQIPYELKIPANLGTEKTIQLQYTVYNETTKLGESPKITLSTSEEVEDSTETENSNENAKLEITMDANPKSTETLLPEQEITYTIEIKNASTVERRVIITGILPEGLIVEEATLTYKEENEEKTENEEIQTQQYYSITKQVLAGETLKLVIKAHVDKEIQVNKIVNEVDAVIQLPNLDGTLEDRECFVGAVNEKIEHSVKQNIPVTDIEIPNEITVKIGEKKNLDIKLIPENATVANIIYSVDNSNIATVTEQGVIEGILEGTTMISVFTENREIAKNCKVNVVKEYSTITPDDPIDPIDPTDPENPSQEEKTYKISGCAWLDENENGVKEEDEELLKGILVKIKNAQTKEYLKNENGDNIVVKTNENGIYEFEGLKAGKYILEFEYDNKAYKLTSATGKDSVANIVTTEQNTVTTTNTITITKKDISNINIGLCLNPIYDLQLDKYVSKITVQNSAGTKVYNYNKEQLAKIDIKAKQLSGSTIIIEYTIEVTNNGDVPGYAKTIVDYLSPELKFNSELNSSWYEGTDNNLYCIELANDAIEPGESRQVKLVVTKTMTSNNTGLVNNTAEIYEDFNEYALEDINSVAGNKQEKENDMSGADTIITVSTGGPILYIGIVIICMLILGGGIYIINKKVINGKKFI